MEAISKIIEGKDFNILPIGDVHYGNINMNLQKFKDLLRWVKDQNNTYIILMGDLCDSIIPSDKRFDIKSVMPHLRDRIDNIAMAEYEEMRNLLHPVKDRILVGLRGNHGETLRKHHGVDFDGWLYKELNITDGGYMTFLRLNFDKSPHKTAPLIFFLHHGFMASRKIGAKMNAIEDLSANFEADLYCMGHSHELAATTKPYLFLRSDGKIIQRKRYYIHTGTFLESYQKGTFNYAEIKCYPPLKVGCMNIMINIDRHNKVNVHVRE